ncbi:MAG: acetyl-CoA sensor PanZ family protein [Alcanivorax sp.]|nr:acetyl-CoA sensor PanZ family protein [Alcanivorax sp.]
MPISAQPSPLQTDQCRQFDKVLRDDPDYHRALTEAAASGSGQLFAAHFNGQPVAVALLAAGAPQLQWMVVHPATRRRGVGRDFLQLIEKQLGQTLTLPDKCHAQ